MCLTKLDQGARQRRAPEDHIENANAIIQEDRRITVCEAVEMLDINLKPAIATEEKNLLAQTDLLHYDSSHPHAAAATRQANRNRKFEVLPHPTYSPVLAPCDFHACGPRKEALHCHRFGCDEEVQKAAHTWIREQPETCLSDVIRKLVDRHKKCVELQGDYVEK